jgi:hypothetical protein
LHAVAAIEPSIGFHRRQIPKSRQSSEQVIAMWRANQRDHQLAARQSADKWQGNGIVAASW